MSEVNKKIDLTRLPKHIAFIMDGNGRWANARNWARQKGHEVGYKKVLTAVKRCCELGIGIVSIYAFSTENWNRPKAEIDGIFKILRENMEKDTKEFDKYGVRVMTMGDVTKFPNDLQDKLTKVIEQTKNNKKCILNFCINYGGRAEILRAVNLLIKDNLEKSLAGGAVSEINDEAFKKYLYSTNLPDPDLIVRTSGEQRISNFMLYQMAYSEFYFPKLFWPAITGKFIDKCVIEFQKRKRRFGKL